MTPDPNIERLRKLGRPVTAPSAADRESLDASREWRPLLNGEYPPPGPTKYGPIEKRDGQTVRPILVYAPRDDG